ncbi:g8590 [Coccomyxa elongata]
MQRSSDTQHRKGAGEAAVTLQESLEGELDAMLATQRPCHYAIANGTHVLWVPKHVPCSFEPSTGRLVVEVGHNARWLAPLHNPRSHLLKVPVSSGVRIEPSRRWVPELRVPRGVPWRRVPVLELDFRKVAKSECCPLAKVRIYSEELRSLREALQLMVARGEAPGSGTDQKGGDTSGGEGSGSDRTPGKGRSMAPIAESAPAESSSSRPQQPPAPSTSPVPPATPVKMSESPPNAGCACFPGLLRRRGAVQEAATALHVEPSAAAAPAGGESSVAPDTPQQKTRREMNAAPLEADAELRSAPYGGPERFFGRGPAAAVGSAPAAAKSGTEIGGAPDQALYRGSGSGRLSSVDEADDSFTAAADAAREAESAFALTGRVGGRTRSGDSVSSVAGPRKGGTSPAAGKTLVWGDSAHDSPTSTTAGPSTAASQRGDYSLGSPLSTTAGPSTATSSQRGSGDSGSTRVFFGLEGAGASAQAGQRTMPRPEFGSGSTTAASSPRPSGEDGIWSSKGSSRGSNETLVERASNFKRSLEAAQYAFYRDIPADAAGAPGAAGSAVKAAAADAVPGRDCHAAPDASAPAGANRGGADAAGKNAVLAARGAAGRPGTAALVMGPVTGTVADAAAAVRSGAAASPAAADHHSPNEAPAVSIPVEQSSDDGAVCAAAGAAHAGPAGRPAARRRATGRSLPDLLLQTAEAVRSCPEFRERRSGNSARAQAPAEAEQGSLKTGDKSGGLRVTHSDGFLTRFSAGDVAGLEIWDTARGPTGQYWDVPRAARSMEAGNRFVLQPGGGNAPARVRLTMRAPPGQLAPAIREQASLIAESKRSCEEVWAPGYESSPDVSSDEEEITPKAAAEQALTAQRLLPTAATPPAAVRHLEAPAAAAPGPASLPRGAAEMAIEAAVLERPPAVAARGAAFPARTGAAAAAAAQLTAAAESPFRVRPRNAAAAAEAAGSAAVPAAQLARPALRPKRLFPSPPGGPPSPDLAQRPDQAAQPTLSTPSPVESRAPQRGASSGGSSLQALESGGSRAMSDQFFDASETPPPEEGSHAQEDSAGHDSGSVLSTPFSQTTQQAAAEPASPNRNAVPTGAGSAAAQLPETPRETGMAELAGRATPTPDSATPQGSAKRGNNGSRDTWLTSGLYANSSTGRGNDTAAGVDDANRQLVSVKLKVAKPRTSTGFVAAAIAALGLSSPAMQRSTSQDRAVSLSVSLLPSPAKERQRLALSPDQVDLSWFTGRISREEPALAGGTGDRVASAAARLLEAGAAASAPAEAAAALAPAGARTASAPSEAAAAQRLPATQAASAPATAATTDASFPREAAPAPATQYSAGQPGWTPPPPVMPAHENISETIAAEHAERSSKATGASERPSTDVLLTGRSSGSKLGNALGNGVEVTPADGGGTEANAPVLQWQKEKVQHPAGKAITPLGALLGETGSETEGSPRPPGLLYKPELRSVAERVKYIERRSHSKNLDSPRPLPGVPSPQSSADAHNSHAGPLNTALQRQPSALTAALQDSNNISALPHIPATGLPAQDQKSLSTAEARPAATISSTAIQNKSNLNGAPNVTEQPPLTFSQRAPSFNNWTEDTL